MQDNYQDVKPQPQPLNEQIYSQQRVADPQYYQQQVPYPPKDNTTALTAAPVSSWFDFSNPSYLKGFVIASGITLVAANPSVQQALIKGGLKIWNFFQGGVEEIKEQIQDVKAEMSQEWRVEALRGRFVMTKVQNVNSAFPLLMAGEGDRVRIVSLKGGRNFCSRLSGIGLNAGSDIEIILSSFLRTDWEEKC